MNRTYVLCAVAIRVSIALATRTFFQPDEYFQSLEVAHHAVFGYGHITWEWLSPKRIRSILYPSLNIPIYWLLKITGLDDTSLLILGPKILHGILASLTDIWVCKLAKKVVGERYVLATYLLSLTSFFHGMSLSRSMSNSLETSLTTVALSYWPWDLQHSSWRSDLNKSLCIAALACSIRPTNAVIWTYMLVMLFRQRGIRQKDVLAVIFDTVLIGVISVIVLGALDSLYYGRLTFTPFNFVLTNLSSVSLFYGSSPWHYYLSQGIPILCTTTLPFVFHGAHITMGRVGTPASRKMLGLMAWTVGIFSLAGHKEWRFIHPLLPLFHILAACSYVDLYCRQIGSGPAGTAWHAVPVIRWSSTFLMTNIILLVYLLRMHERAQIDVMYYLRSLPHNDVRSIGFLMPCHSTPWQSYLHRQTMSDSSRFWALGCEPPLLLCPYADYDSYHSNQDITKYKDQTDVFYDSPVAYLRDRFPPVVNLQFPPSPYPFSPPGNGSSEDPWKHEWPQYIVSFGALLEDTRVKQLFARHGYELVWHEESGFEGDPRRRGGISVMSADMHGQP